MKTITFALVLPIFSCLCPVVFATTIDDVQESIEKWIDTNRIISETRRDWASEQSLLSQEAKLLELELSELEEKGERLEKLNNQARLEREEAITKNLRFAELSAYLEKKANALESKVLKLMPAFPEPLLDRVASSRAKIGDRPRGEERMSVSARMQALVSIISDAEKFNEGLTITHEIRTGAAGESVQVRVLYWGLAGAYAVSPSGDIAQIGRPSLGGWTWEDRPEFAAQIDELIRIREGVTEAAFVQAPMSVGDVGND